MAINFHSVIPVVRIFDIAKADEFYQEFLGFSVDWDHRFEDNTPLYRQISKGTLILHLSEHHGDGSPGTNIRIMMSGINEYHREITSKNYRYMKPGLESGPAEMLEMCVIDPFGNRITFCQKNDEKKVDVS
jgi:catechol 2,3-dioxygenase-like lactoylglutathione lyase family enzyme